MKRGGGRGGGGHFSIFWLNSAPPLLNEMSNNEVSNNEISNYELSNT
jgi:hypothetical protein